MTLFRIVLVGLLLAASPLLAQPPPPAALDLAGVLTLADRANPRLELERQGIALAEAERRNALAAEAASAYVALLAAQEKQALLGASLQDLQRLREIVAGRRASGMASDYDLLRVEIDLARWRSAVANARAGLIKQQGQLVALLGFPGWQPEARAEDLCPLDLPPPFMPLNEHPEVTAARREEAAADASVIAARRDHLPELSLNAGQFWTRAPYGRTHIIGLSIEIPLFDTRRGAWQRARAEAHTAHWQRVLVEAQMSAEAERHAARVRERTAALRAFRSEVEPQLPALRQMAEDGYRLGLHSIIELLDAVRASYEASIHRIELTTHLLDAQLRLQAARGELLADAQE